MILPQPLYHRGAPNVGPVTGISPGRASPSGREGLTCNDRFAAPASYGLPVFLCEPTASGVRMRSGSRSLEETLDVYQKESETAQNGRGLSLTNTTTSRRGTAHREWGEKLSGHSSTRMLAR